MTHIRKRGRGFTLIELIIVVVIVLFIIAMLLTTTCGSTERANRVKCASNLKQIGMGMVLYSNANGNVTPRVRADAQSGVGRGFTGAAAANPFAPDGPAVNDPTAALFLLVRGADLNPEVFVCPSSNQEKDTLGGLSVDKWSNFSAAVNLSYSVNNPYPKQAAVDLKYMQVRFGGNEPPLDLPIAADRNDGEIDLMVSPNSPASLQKKLNSLNHEREGMNVLYADGHVEWMTNSWAGAKRDNIYTAAATDGGTPPGPTEPPGSVAGVEPQWQFDTVLVPARGHGF